MILKSVSLQNFRNHKSLDINFNSKVAFIVGPNGSGKTNLLDSIYFLAHGTSLKSRDEDVIRFGEFITRVKARLLTPEHSDGGQGEAEEVALEVVIHKDRDSGRVTKKFSVNGVSKRRPDFMGNLVVVSFSPQSLDIAGGAPGARREFLDSVLEGVDRDYRIAKTAYDKGLRQRNALLGRLKDGFQVSNRQFEYWDKLLIENGNIITKKREEFIDFINKEKKEIFDFLLIYDRSEISEERFLKYFDAERGAGVTLVGPHRDDFFIEMFDKQANAAKDTKTFGSRGQQRLATLQLKIIEILFVKKSLDILPILLLDDIFSELDHENIEAVKLLIGRQQTIATATHGEFVKNKLQQDSAVIELRK